MIFLKSVFLIYIWTLLRLFNNFLIFFLHFQTLVLQKLNHFLTLLFRIANFLQLHLPSFFYPFHLLLKPKSNFPNFLLIKTPLLFQPFLIIPLILLRQKHKFIEHLVFDPWNSHEYLRKRIIIMVQKSVHLLLADTEQVVFSQ